MHVFILKLQNVHLDRFTTASPLYPSPIENSASRYQLLKHISQKPKMNASVQPV